MVVELSKSTALVLMVTIVNRGTGEKVDDLLRSEGAVLNFLSYGRGTASSEILDYLGLVETQKEIVFSAMPYSTSKRIVKKVIEQFGLSKPGKGVIFTVPISSICGKHFSKALSNMAAQGGDSIMEKTNFELMIIITTRGYADDVMKAAKAADAAGGTVIHARGTGAKEVEKFFGITIQPEKDLIFILTHVETRSQIMKAIISKYGPTTEARSLVFSVPVSELGGLPAGFMEQ